jgi:hypothetical protein
MRKLTLISVCMSVVVCVALFDLKNRVTTLDRELQRLQREIVATNQTVHILQAEWAHLNQPDILNQLVSEHTALAPISAEQLITLADITRESAAAVASAGMQQQEFRQQANAVDTIDVAVFQR